VAASGGSLSAGSVNNQSSGGLTINGATVTVSPFTNAGTATLQSGSLSVGTVANSGTLNLNGGTFTRGAATTFGNSGTVNLNFGTLSLGGGEGSSSGGNYAVGSGATLRLSGGSYHVGSLGGAGSSEIDGGDVTAAAVSVAAGGQLRMLAGALSSTGALSNSGSVVASGGLLNAGSIDNNSGGGLTINGATVTTGPFTNAGMATATLQSGSLSVGAVANSGTLNLKGESFTRTARATFENSGIVNLNTGTLSLDGGDGGGVGGGSYNIASGTTLAFTGGTYRVSSIAGPGSVQIEGIVSPAKLDWDGTMTIKVQKLTIKAGTFSAGIDPPDLTLDVPGGMTLTGGSGNEAFALIAGDNVSIKTSTMNLTGGAGSGSFAGIQAVSGGAKVQVDKGIDLVLGTGQSAGAWMSAAGELQIKALSCNGCALLTDDPFGSTTGQTGLYGHPVSLSLPGLVEVPSSVIVGVQTAQMGGEGDAVLGEEEEEEKEKEQSSDETRAKEEQKNEKPLQVCM
jgi:hypothetical protein